MANRERVGQQVGDYRLLRRLGGGGFGEVYLGEHVHTHTQVAVKVLHGRLTDSSDLKEFINEARTIRLKHPHIVPLLDFGIASDDVPYLVMEYAPRGTLRDRHPKGSRVPLSTIVSYIVPLASALHYAHEQHLIHRDVKPENMLLGANGELLLSDFGIVTVAHSSGSLDATSVVGTPLYMAPEQLQGKPRPASDQYALAIVTYEWLTGARPFNGTYLELIVQHAITPPPPLQRPDLPAEVEQVLLMALAKDPKDRFATVQAFAQAFVQAAQPVLETVAVVSPEPSLAMIEQLSTSPWTDPPRSLHAPGPSAYLLPSVFPTASATAHSATTSHSAFPSLPLQPRSVMPHDARKGRKGIRPRLLVLICVGLALLLGSTGLLWTTITTNALHTQATASALVTTATQQASITAYERYVASNGAMFGFDARHSHANPFEQMLTPATVANLHLAWSFPAGAFINSDPAVVGGVVYVSTGSGALYAIDAASGTQKWRFPSGVFSASSSPAVVNGVVYVNSGDGNLYAINAATGTQKWRFPTGSFSVASAPAVVNGVVYVVSGNGNLYAVDAATGTQKWSFPSTSSSPAVVDGVVYVGSGNGNLYAIDAATGTRKWNFPTGYSIATSPAVVGGVVYVSSGSGALYAIDAVTGTQKWRFSSGTFNATSSPAVAGDVVYVNSKDGRLYAINAITGKQKWSFSAGTLYSVSPPTLAGGVVYTGWLDHRLYTIDAATGLKKWSFSTGDVIDASAVVANGVVYIGSQDSSLYALRLPT